MFMSKTANKHIVGDGLGVNVPMPGQLVRWVEDLGFLAIIDKAGLDPALAYALCCQEQKVDWYCVDTEALFFLCG